jgi:bifunctional NMN adenylyltransferase/nudix hydrolase
MTEKKYDLVVFIGRFQPFHNAHMEIVYKAYEYSNEILFMIGSAFQPPTFKNPISEHYDRTPFCVQELITDSIEHFYNLKENLPQEHNLGYMLVEDTYDDIEWCLSIQNKVTEYLGGYSADAKIALIGCNKDESSYYLKMFPQWDLIEIERNQNLSATHIRELYFVEEPNMEFIRGVVPPPVFDILNQYKHSEWHNHIVNERRFIEKYKSQYASLPYPPVFVTVDSVVFQSGHVLLVRRNAYPGKGLMALPGGFLDANSDRSLEDAMIRELREETGLKVPSPVLRGNIKKTKVFDAIARSSRGRTITHAYNIVLPDGELPRVKGGSDADKAFWLPLSELDSSQFFEDHYQIINYFI